MKIPAEYSLNDKNVSIPAEIEIESQHFKRNYPLNFFLNKDKIKRTLGEGTFGKVVEVKDSYE